MYFDKLQPLWDLYMEGVEEIVPTGMPHTVDIDVPSWPPVNHHTPPRANLVSCYCDTCSRNHGRCIEWGLTNEEEMQLLYNGA